jgi:hypothetical protein
MNYYFHGLITLLYSAQYKTKLSLKHGFQLSLLTIWVLCKYLFTSSIYHKMKFSYITLSALIASRAIYAAPHSFENDIAPLVEDRSPNLQHDVMARLGNANAAGFTVVNQAVSNFRKNLGTAPGK